MNMLSISEQKMWESLPTKKPSKTTKKELTDWQLSEKYMSHEGRILLGTNREKLPIFVEELKKKGYMELRSLDQRKPGWDEIKQSRLIESFLLNIPVPPIILYETSYNSYQVLDGQNRIIAIRDFYNNNLTLTGLELLPEINGRNYQQLPARIKSGIDRRSLSSIAIITESKPDEEQALFLKQQIFERLNSGGVDLTPQEVRNCLYQGQFNSLLMELSRHPVFVKAWELPHNNYEIQKNKNSLYQKMEYVELVLRFFALRHVDNFCKGMKYFLDLYMMKSLRFSETDILELKAIFEQTIALAHQIYGINLFKPFDSKSQRWSKRRYKAYYDAVMVGFSRHLDRADLLINCQEKVIESTKKLFDQEDSRLLTGEGKTKADIQKRIKLFDDMLSQVIAE
jgi:Protein of unknown function DUF262